MSRSGPTQAQSSLDIAENGHLYFFSVGSELFGMVFLVTNIVDRLSNARFLVGKKGFLQDGQFFSFGLQLLQMLCPFSHIEIGGFMYS
jgi:hypothetical protein